MYKKYTWLITGVSGFVGSNLLNELLNLDQKVVGVDNFSNSSANNYKYFFYQNTILSIANIRNPIFKQLRRY